MKISNPRSRHKSRKRTEPAVAELPAARGCNLVQDAPAVAGWAVLAGLYFLPVLAQGSDVVLSKSGTDTWRQFFYWRHFAYESLSRGEWPLWNPYIYSGTPFLAGIQSAVFYPFHVVYLLFGTAFAINLIIAVHCFLATVFTYLYARYVGLSRPASTVAGLTFGYSAPYFLHIYAGHLSHLCTMVWLPLLFIVAEAFLRERKIQYALGGAILLAVQVFAGHPQYVFYSVIAVTLYFLMRVALDAMQGDAKRPLFACGGWGLMLTTGLLLAAAQLAPAFELARYSVRESLTYDWVASFSLVPEMLVTLLVPDFFGDSVSVPYWGRNYLWEMSVYLGVVPLVLAVAALVYDRRREVWVFSLIAALALILALGKYTPLFPLLYAYVPGFNLFRGISKFVFVFSFAVAVLAGYGLDRLTGLARAHDSRLDTLGFVILIVSVLVAGAGALFRLYGIDVWRSVIESAKISEDHYLLFPDLTEDFFNASLSVAYGALLKTCLLAAVFGSLLLLFPRIKTVPQDFLPLCWVLLTVIDLWHFGARYLVTFDPRELRMDPEVKGFLQTQQEPFRVGTPGFRLVNIGMLEGIENVGGFDAFVLKNYNEFMNFAQRRPVEEPYLAMNLRGYSPLLDLLNVKYYVVSAGMNLQLPGFALAFQNHEYWVYQKQGALPRSFIVHQAWVMKDRDTILRHMASADFDPTSYAILEEDIQGLPGSGAAQSPLPEMVERSPNRVTIKARLDKPGLLVLGDAYYPGWRVFVDGRESRIYRANYVMRAVLLPEGQHVVEFRYDPLSFKIGAVVTLLTLVAVLGWLGWVAVQRFKH